MGWLVPNFGKGGSVGDSGLSILAFGFGLESVHLFLPFKADTPARIFSNLEKKIGLAPLMIT